MFLIILIVLLCTHIVHNFGVKNKYSILFYSIPKALQEKGRQLVSRLKTTQWNDRGELLHEGVVVPGSNVVDLVHDLLRKRKTSDPIGWQQFGSQMRAANIPMELVGNVARRRHIQQRKRTLTPKQKKGRRVQLPDDW